ncbi:MAG: NAD-dependent epimerase/dehydratase family protein [Myxococcaceae bacterium]
MNVLLIGGTRFVGHYLVFRLLAQGHRVTVLNRGVTPDSLGPRVERLRADRGTDAFDRALAGKRFDGVVDFAAYRPEEVERAVRVLRGNVGHYIFISTGQVYLVREGCPSPAREGDFEGRLIPRPQDGPDLEEWNYGVFKRQCETVLSQAADFPSTRLRIPMVNGERDYYRRLESYLWRLLDGGPLLVPDGGTEVCRHVYGLDVADVSTALLGHSNFFGRAFNLAQWEAPPLWELLGLLSEALGTPERRVSLPAETITRAGLRLQEVSPYSTRWMSYLDPSLARAELHFRSTSLPDVLASVVRAFLTSPPSIPPPGYQGRPEEQKLGSRGG